MEKPRVERRLRNRRNLLKAAAAGGALAAALRATGSAGAAAGDPLVAGRTTPAPTRPCSPRTRAAPRRWW